MCFFFLMSYYMKQAGKILQNKSRWKVIFQVLWPTSLILFMLVELYTVVKVSENQVTDATLCKTSTYLIMQFSNTAIVIAFAILGAFISLRIKQQGEAETKEEMLFRQ